MGAEGRGTGLQRDPLQGKTDHTDGQAQEVLQRASGRSGQLASVPVRRKADQRRRDSEGPRDGAGRRHRGLPGADGRAVVPAYTSIPDYSYFIIHLKLERIIIVATRPFLDPGMLQF